MCNCRPGEFECPTAVSLREISNHWYRLKHEVNYKETRAMYIAHMRQVEESDEG